MSYVPVLASRFAYACEQQGARLNDELRKFSFDGCKRPTRKLVSIAGVLLRNDPSTRLATGIIRPEEVYPQDVVSRILRGIINASIEPVPTREGVPYFSHQSLTRPVGCCAAETGFALTLNTIREGRFTGTDYGGEIYVDDEGLAFALRKHRGFSSALALTKVNFGGIEFPEGSLLSLETSTPGNTQGYYKLDGSRFVLRSLSEVVGAGFGRLTAFALPPEQREINSSIPVEAAAEGHYHLLRTLPTEQLQSLVQSAADALMNNGAVPCNGVPS